MCIKAPFYIPNTQTKLLLEQNQIDHSILFYIHGGEQNYHLSLLEQYWNINNASISKMQHLRFPTPPITPPKYYNGVTEHQQAEQPAQQHYQLEMPTPQRTQSVIMQVGRQQEQRSFSSINLTADVKDAKSVEITSPLDDNAQNFNCTELRNALSDREYSSYSSASSDSECICQWLDCGRTFENLESLAAHIAQIHAVVTVTDGLFHCHWRGCMRSNRGFNARYKMLVHVRTHTKEKPHQCHLCKKCFSRAENLKIHIRSHSGEKPYVCNFKGCNKAYSNSSDRFKHSRTHAIEKPYVCKVAGCQKRYTDPSSLRKHVKTFKHNLQIIKDDAEKTSKQEKLPKLIPAETTSYEYSSNTQNKLPTPPITEYAAHYMHVPMNTAVYPVNPHIYYAGHYETDPLMPQFYATHENLTNNDCALMSCDVPLDLRIKRN